MQKELELVLEFQKEMGLLGQAGALLNWDEETYMPHDGINSRAEQAALISKLIHQKMTSPALYSALVKLKKAGNKIKGKDKLMVEKLYKDISNARKIPNRLVEELSRATTLGSQNWRRARKEKKFEIFQPYLEKIVKLKREYAKLIGLPGHPYNSLLDDYEENMTVEKIKPVFVDLKRELVALLRRIESSETYKKQKKNILSQEDKFDRTNMEFFVHDIAERMGLDKGKVRIDVSEHPFTTKIGVGDVRFTTNYRKDPLFSIGSTIHEAGHALYEVGMPEKDAYNVLGDAPSLGLHESQSRFWENMIGKGKPFWKYYFPRFKEKLKLHGDFDEWYHELNQVTKGKIRIESDEVHYCLHVILRFELELGLIDGSVNVKDLPKLWNAKMKELFGVVPEHPVEGVLQDVHWSQGYFGYFPTYALGTIYAAQFYTQLKKENKNIEIEIAKGDFSKVREWLKEQVHKHGSMLFADDIVKRVCGSGLDAGAYTDYLNKKYGELYGF